MSQLDDFNGGPSYNLDDIVGTPETKVPVTSLASNRNIAAHTSLLSPNPDDITQIYAQSEDELNLNGQSDTADSVIANVKGQTMAGYQGAAANLLLDPNAADDYKRAALAQVNDPNNKLYSPRAMVATKAASQIVPTETNEAANLRGVFAQGITDVLDYQRKKQQAYNEMQVRESSQTAAGYVNIAESFLPGVYGYKQAHLTNELEGGDDTYGVKTLWNSVFAGATQAKRRDAFNRIPLEDRARALDHLMDIVSNDGKTLLLPDHMDNANMRDVQNTVDAGSYTATDETIDNILGVLDIVGTGSLLRGGIRALRGTTKAGEAGTAAKATEAMSDEARTWQRRFTQSDVQPTTPSQAIKDANPEMARNFHDAAVKDSTDTVSNAMYGAPRQDAITHDIGPQVSAVDGSVQSKVYHPERDSDFSFMPDADVMDFVENSGAHHFSPAEKVRMRAQVTNDFTNATGFVQRKEMSTVEDLPDGVSFKSVIGPSDSGWSSAEDAIQQAAFAYKNYGISPNDIKFLMREGDNYVPVDMQTASAMDKAIPIYQDVEKVVPANPGKAPVEGDQFHGTSGDIPSFNNSYANAGSDKNIYGSGVYTTDNIDIAKGYSNKGKGPAKNIYHMSPKEGINDKLFNMEAPLSAKDLKVVKDNLGEFPLTNAETGEKLSSLRDIYDEFRRESRNEGLSRGDVQEAFDGIKGYLESQGYRGFSHKGGSLTGNVEHNVKIYWNPEEDLVTRKANEYFDTPEVRTTEKVQVGEQKQAGDFLLQITHTHKFDAADVAEDGWEAFTVKRNLMDSWAKGTGRSGQGSLASNLLDPQSMLDFNVTKGATISGARGSQLESLASRSTNNYVKAVKGLGKTEQQSLFSLIRENNVKGLDFNYTQMRAQGFSEEGIKAAEHWKTAQDTNWMLSNRDMIKSYNARGYGIMEHSDSGTRLLVKEQSRQAIPDKASVLDPISGEVKVMSREEITAHYDSGGNIAKTANPMDVKGENVDFVLNQNAANSTYVRKLNNYDTVLNKRKGYYAVKYDQPHFIEKKLVDKNGKPILDASGNVRWKAVATADSIPNAKRGIARLTSTTGGEYRFRKDLKGEDFDAAVSQSLQSGGMSSQRIRGERLEESLGSNNISSDMHLEAPVNSLIHSTASIAHRVAHRDWLETMKARFISQYADVLPKKAGRVQYPSDRREIGVAGIESKMARDARTTYEYIRQIENGFINSIDDGYKAAFNSFADAFGNKGMGTIEKGLRGVASLQGPAALTKQLAFNLLLALNPLRQFLVQSHQAMMLAASFPRYAVSRLIPDLTIVMTKHLAEGTGVKIPDGFFTQWGRTAAEAEEMFQALKGSGIAAGIRQHDLVRGGLNSLADSSAASRFSFGATPVKMVGKALKAGLAIPRKIGFDFGEYISSSASFLAHYDDALRKGVKMDKAGLEDVFAKSRNYVYNMDRAGAMPYNHNSLSMFTQFLQVPHKALTQLFTNRALSRAQRMKMTVFMTAMYGPTAVVGIIPGAGSAVENFFGELFPQEPVLRQALRTGLENHFINKLLTQQFGEEVRIDTSSLAPLDAYGITKFVQTATDEGLTKIITNSPGGSLLFGTNPRLSQVLTTFGTMMGMGPLKENDPTKWSNMWMDIANLSSGFSNAYKANMMLTYQNKYGTLGGVTDTNVNTPQAIAQAFGLPTMDSENARKAGDFMYKSQENFDNDVKGIFNKYAKVMVQDGVTADQFEYMVNMAQIEMQACGNNDRCAQIWMGEMNKQLDSGDARLYEQIYKFSDIGSEQDLRNLIDKAPGLTEEQRNNLRDVISYKFEQADGGDK